MWNNDIRLDYIEDLLFSNKLLLKNLIESSDNYNIFQSKVNIIEEINSLFPNVSQEDKFKLLYILYKAYFRENDDKTQLIWSGPNVAGVHGRNTELVFEEIIQEAKFSVIITIYSLSEYGKNIIELLKKKAKQGVYVEIYVNDFDSKSHLLKDILSTNSKRLFVYEYTGARNSTQALHAKVLTIDDKKAVITSSNLSYNGMDGNLELGVILESKDRAKEIRAIFNLLIQKYYFKRINFTRS